MLTILALWVDGKKLVDFLLAIITIKHDHFTSDTSRQQFLWLSCIRCSNLIILIIIVTCSVLVAIIGAFAEKGAQVIGLW